MIASVRGTVAALSTDSAVIEVGGVGLVVFCGPNTLSGLRVGASARLATSLVVREDSLTLYGFADDDARRLFELLQTASGVGPRLAQAAITVHPPDVLRRAIATGDVSILTQVPGVGKKGAERLILELRDKVGPVDARSSATPAAVGWGIQVREALTGLGWTAGQAEQAVAAVAENLDGQPVPPVPVLLRQAIRLLGPVR